MSVHVLYFIGKAEWWEVFQLKCGQKASIFSEVLILFTLTSQDRCSFKLYKDEKIKLLIKL